MKYLLDHFGPGLLEREFKQIEITPITRDAARAFVNGSDTPVIIGIQDQAKCRLVGDDLGAHLRACDVVPTLRQDDEALVAHYIGPNPMRGIASMPPGATIEYWLVNMVSFD